MSLDKGALKEAVRDELNANTDSEVSKMTTAEFRRNVDMKIEGVEKRNPDSPVFDVDISIEVEKYPVLRANFTYDLFAAEVTNSDILHF